MFSSLSIVIPAYNEADRIADTLRHIAERVSRYAREYSVIVVDDGSTDDTFRVATSAGLEFFSAAKFQCIRIPHSGKGKAVQTGVLAAPGEWILFMDADNSTTIDALNRFLPHISKAPIIIASRALADKSVRRQELGYRRVVGNIYNAIMRRLCKIPFRDTQCGFKLLRRAQARSLFGCLREFGFSFDTELLFLAVRKDLKVCEVAVDWSASGRSSVKVIRDGWRMLRALLRMRWRALAAEQRREIFWLLGLAAILFCVFAYRAGTLNYSLPDGTIFGHTRSYFQDEDAVVADTARLIAAVKENPLNVFDPGPTVYPVFGGLLSMVPLGFVYLFKYRGVDVASLFAASPQAQAQFYTLIAFSGRCISFLSAFLAIVVFYCLARELRVRRHLAVGLAFLYALMPVDILLSIEAKTNALLNLLLLLILWLSLRWLRTGKEKLLWWAVLLVGMAMGTRLNGLLGGAIIAFAILARYKCRLDRFFWERKQRLILLILPIVGLLIASPHLAAHPSYIQRMWSRAGSGSLRLSFDMDWHGITASLRMLSGGWIGAVFFLAVLTHAVYLLARGKSAEKLVAAWLLFYLVVFMQTTVPIIRYAYPLLPVWLLLMGGCIEKNMDSLPRWTRYVLWCMLTAWAVSIALFGIAYIKVLKKPPLQHTTNAFLEEVAPPGSSVGTYFNETFYNRVPVDYRKYAVFPCRDLEEGTRPLESFNTSTDFLVVPTRGVECMQKIFNISERYEFLASFAQPIALGPWTWNVNGAGAYRPTPIIIYKKK